MSEHEMASDLDFAKISGLLHIDDLHELYLALDMNSRDIETAQIDAPSPAVGIQACSVLAEWRRQNGNKATRQALLDGLERCGNIEAKERLDAIWNGRGWNAKPEANFYKIIEPLGSEELLRLYQVLGLTSADIERAESRVKSHDLHQKAQSVIRWWRKRNGRKATCEKLQEAVKKCKRETTTAKPIATKEASDLDIQLVQEQLKEEYRETRGKLPLLPGMPEEFADMEDVFVDLEINREVKKPSDVIYKELKSYGDLVCIERKTKSGQDKDFVKRILVKGKPGIGKSTIVSKLAYDWACNKQDSPMSRFELVLVVTINEINTDTDLIGVIQDQLLPEVSRQGLKDYLQYNASSVAILLDGYDEATSHFDRCKDITNVLRSKWLASSLITVTTRPNHVSKFCQMYRPASYLQVRVNGFSCEAQERYVNRFLHVRGENSTNASDVNDDEEDGGDDETAHDDHDHHGDDDDHGHGARNFLWRIRGSPSLRDLAVIPIILSMLCLLWTPDAKLPISVTALYKDILLHLAKHKYAKITRDDLDEADIGDWIEGVMFRVGERAFIGLFEDKLVFRDDEFTRQCLDEACSLGIIIMTKERKRSRASVERRVTFLHKTFQEMCAASYLAKLVDVDMETFRGHLERIVDTNMSQMKTFLRFACGLNVSAAEYILRHVVQIMYGRWKRDRKGMLYGARLYNYQSVHLDKVHGYQRMPLYLLYEADVNTHANNCSSIHKSMKPLCNSIRVSQLPQYDDDFSDDFLEVMKYFTNKAKEGYTWLEDVTEIEIGAQKLSSVFHIQEKVNALNMHVIELLCSMTRVCVVRLTNTSTEQPVQLAPFFDLLNQHHFAPPSLSEVYLHEVCCDAAPLGVLLSALSCLKKLDFYDVSVKGEVSAADVSLQQLTELSIKMHKSADATGNETSGFEAVAFPGMMIRALYAKYYFSTTMTTVLFYSLFSSLSSLTKLKLVHVALDGDVSCVISFPSLKHLHIEGVCHKLIMMILCGFSETTLSHDQTRSNGNHYCVPLASIYIKNIRFDEARELLGEAMRYMPHLRRLVLPFEYEISTKLAFRGIEDAEWEKIFDDFAGALQQMKKCKCNTKSGTNSTSDVKGSELQELDLSGNHLGNSVKNFVGAYRYMPELKCLNLNYGSFWDTGFLEVLFDAFIEAGIKSGTVGLPLEFLDLSWKMVNNKLAEAYIYMTHLKSLKLENSFYSVYLDQDADCACLIDALIKSGIDMEHGLPLEVLDLTGNLIWDPAAAKLATAFKYMTNLREFYCSELLSLAVCEVLFDGLINAGKINHGGLTLEVLYLPGSKVGDSVGKLSQAFLHMPNLKVLDLSYTRLGPSQCGVLFDGFVVAAGTQISDQQADISTDSDDEILPSRGLQMETLMLQGNEIGESVNKFCEALRHMSCLRKLDASSCGLQEERKLMVEAVLKETIPDFMYYHVSNNFGIG